MVYICILVSEKQYSVGEKFHWYENSEGYQGGDK